MQRHRARVSLITVKCQYCINGENRSGTDSDTVKMFIINTKLNIGRHGNGNVTYKQTVTS